MTKDLNIGGLLRERRLQQGKTLKQIASRAFTDRATCRASSATNSSSACRACWRSATLSTGARRNSCAAWNGAGAHRGRAAEGLQRQRGGGLDLTAGDRLQVSFTARLAPGKE
ncbi:hypothetical protein HML84_16440 [Alcanivorax sp. IO_7]|nr:hypothetical protein HML84_16440 [Alcanivorax sp. IO_7]